MELRLLFLFFLVILHLAGVSSQFDDSHNLHNEGEEAFPNVDKLPTQPAGGVPEKFGKDLLNHMAQSGLFSGGVSEKFGKNLLNHMAQPDILPIIYGGGAHENFGKDLLNHMAQPDLLPIIYGGGAPEKIEKDLLNHKAQSDLFSGGASEKFGKDLLNHMAQPDMLPIIYGGGAHENFGKDLLNHMAQPDLLPIIYGGGAPMKDSKLMKGNVASFFLENDLLLGKTMKLHFTNPITGAKFLPLDIAKSIPFASNKLPEILNRFNIEPKSSDVEIVKQTISLCEGQKSIETEHKYCATSLESLIDFSRSKLGEDIKIYSTEVDEEIKQDYKIIKESIVKLGDKSVVCHKLNYMYAVYYCHHVHATKVYMATLEGENGVKENAIAACHADTKGWNPKHLAFQLLNIKPGTDTICHFLSSDTLVLVPQKDKDVSY
nr:BURP [synthetic construct]